eukprot:TRINITY_DN6393_c2_g1_i1.p1 TRINITY_DN6393_c2_g1~~TRINITY_DN6393_c2_g1_i1.p1  ORF type:complete len:395 (-),score=32.87 TRINITY_DN6393_c2_g1_i1:89-1273(-)
MPMTEQLMFHFPSTHGECERDIIIHKGYSEIKIDVMEQIFSCLNNLATCMLFGPHWRWIAQCLKGTHEEGEGDVIIHGEEESELGFSNPDVMEQVFTRLNDVVTRIRFSAVCRSWRRVAQCSSSRHDKKPIWWVFDYFEFDRTYKFFSFADGVTYKLHGPKSVWWNCCGSYEGWLIMQTNCWIGNKVMLVEPLSRTQIRLPIMNLDNLRAGGKWSIISSAFLSSPPKSNDGADNNNCLVVAVDFRKNLHLCRIGDKSWTRHDMDCGLLSEFSYWEMLLLHQGTTALVPGDSRNRVLAMEFDDHLNLRAKIHHLSPWIHGHYRVTNYFVEWCGEILLVAHEFSLGDGIFHVYKIGSSWNLVKVKSLGDGVIFLTNTQTRCFSASDFPALNLKGNL